MRKPFVVLSGSMLVILIIASLTTFYFKHKTRYLHIEAYQSSAYVDVIGEIYFKDYPNTKTITDTASIKKNPVSICIWIF